MPSFALVAAALSSYPPRSMSAGAGAGRSSDPCAARLPALANSTLASLVRCGAVVEQGSAGSLAGVGGGISFAGNGVGGGLHDAAASGTDNILLSLGGRPCVGCHGVEVVHVPYGVEITCSKYRWGPYICVNMMSSQ